MLKILTAGVLGMTFHHASALTINFDYSLDTNGFFTNQQDRKDVLEAAASFYEARIDDNLTAITSAGSNQFTATINHPGTGAGLDIDSFSVGADALTVFVGGRDLPGSFLGRGGFGGFSASGSPDFLDIAQARGQTGALTTPPTDFGPWGGFIAFDTDTDNFYFDNDVNTLDVPSGSFDFYSIAVHELGHLFGLGTAGSWSAQAANGSFTGSASTAVHGSNPPLDGDGVHWADGILSSVDGNSQEAAMDPSLFIGTRKDFTELDLAGLSDVGWNVAPIPVPAAFWLLGSGLLGLFGLKKRCLGTGT